MESEERARQAVMLCLHVYCVCGLLLFLKFSGMVRTMSRKAYTFIFLMTCVLTLEIERMIDIFKLSTGCFRVYVVLYFVVLWFENNWRVGQRHRSMITSVLGYMLLETSVKLSIDLMKDLVFPIYEDIIRLLA